MSGVNTTDPLARSVHGTNPQNLVEKILRGRIHNSFYWKAHCFALTAETLLEKAVQLQYIGSTYAANAKPTPFICLTLKLLQIQPEQDIVLEYIKQEDYKYVRALGAFYLRLVGRPFDIYQYLEPLYNDYRKLRVRTPEGWSITHMDEFVDDLLHKETVIGIALPRLPKRHQLEDAGHLKPRVSALQDEFESLEQQGLLDPSKDKSTLGEDTKSENKEKDEKVENGNNTKHNGEHKHSQDDEEERRRKSRHRSSSSERDRSRRSRRRHHSRSRSRSRDRDRSRSRSRSKRSSSRRSSRRKRRSSSDSEGGHRSSRRSSRSKKERSTDRDRQHKRSEREANGSEDKESPTAAAKSVAREGSTEYWNEMRKKMGMKPLK